MTQRHLVLTNKQTHTLFSTLPSPYWKGGCSTGHLFGRLPPQAAQVAPMFSRWLWNVVPVAHDYGREARPFTQPTQLFCMSPTREDGDIHRGQSPIWKGEVKWCQQSLSRAAITPWNWIRLRRGMWWSSFPNIFGRSHAGQCNLWETTGLSNRVRVFSAYLRRKLNLQDFFGH